MTGLTDVQKQLMGFIASALYDKPLEVQKDVDWTELYQEASIQTVLPLVFPVAEKWMPEEDRKTWKRLSDQFVLLNMMVSYDHVELHNLLTSHGIPYVILKGLASASYYREPLLRTFGDVDFLIHKDDMERVGKLLLDLGFEPEEVTEIHVGYHKNTGIGGHFSEWEMHYEVNGIPSSSTGEIIRSYFADIYETAVDYAEGNGTVKIPDPFHHGMILLLHTASHLTNEGIGLRHLCDWLVFADSMPEEEFTAIFEERLKAAGLWSFTQQLTLCGIRYLGCPPKSWAGEADEARLKALICDICNGGNFGKKDKDRDWQKKYISDSKTRTVDDKGTFSQLFNAINKRTRDECGFVKNIPVLLPLGWVCTTVQYLIRVLRGQSRFDHMETLENAASRMRIYKEFHLFEGE
jgi:hypothetical protein